MRKRGFRFPRQGEKHSILWEIAGVLLLIEIVISIFK
jgi:hypothetical protein